MKLYQNFKMREVKTDSTQGKNKLTCDRAMEVNIVSSANPHNSWEKKMKNSEYGLIHISPQNWHF